MRLILLDCCLKIRCTLYTVIVIHDDDEYFLLFKLIKTLHPIE